MKDQLSRVYLPQAPKEQNGAKKKKRCGPDWVKAVDGATIENQRSKPNKDGMDASKAANSLRAQTHSLTTLVGSVIPAVVGHHRGLL